MKTKVHMNTELIARLKQFMNDEAMSCSMDYGCITPLYIYRMWGGSVALEDIEKALKEIKKKVHHECLDNVCNNCSATRGG